MENTTSSAGATGPRLTDAGSPMQALPDDWCQHHFDYLSEELAASLPGTMARMRELCPVAYSEEHGGYWIASSYEDVLSVAQNWEVFSSAHGLSISRQRGVVRNLPVEADPPEQRIYKRLVNPFFTPAAVSRWEQQTRDLVTRLIDDFIETGACEFMDAFARQFPSLAFFDFALNAPPEDLEKVAFLASRSSTPQAPDARECWLGLYAWIKDFAEQRRNQPPRGDVVDAILAAEIDGRPITEDEVIGTIQLLILGGLETTAGSLGLIFLRFCNQPEIPALLREKPELITGAVQELLRIDPPFAAVARTAMRDTELGGRQIKQGDKVLIHWASANWDEGEFERADVFDAARERNRHLTFGAGPHRCAGSNFARQNLRIALEELVRRLHGIRLADGADIHFHAGLTRSPLNLPVTFTPGPRVVQEGAA